MLRKHNIATAPLLLRAGLSEHGLARSANDRDGLPLRVSAVGQCRFLEYAAEAMDDSAFGLHLAGHQDRSSPFRLMRVDTASTPEGLGALALMRRQELDGFIEGLFGREEVVDLPKRAHRGLDQLGQMRALFEAVGHLAQDDTKQPTDKGVRKLTRHSDNHGSRDLRRISAQTSRPLSRGDCGSPLTGPHGPKLSTAWG